jgi:hypothetical protein
VGEWVDVQMLPRKAAPGIALPVTMLPPAPASATLSPVTLPPSRSPHLPSCPVPLCSHALSCAPLQVKAALPALARLIHSQDEEVLTDACWALSYLSDGTNDKIQEVISSGVCRRLVELLL